MGLRLLHAAGAAAALVGLLSGCDPYDAALLRRGTTSSSTSSCGDGRVDSEEACDIAIPDGMEGACPGECPTVDACFARVKAGSACQTQCVGLTTTKAVNDDGCCPAGVGPGEDSDCGSCGDGIVGPKETCDPPGTCPGSEDCTSGNACLVAVFSGAAESCTAMCRFELAATCESGDGCCPAGCNTQSDDDCSASCGNEVVESEHGETCEIGDELQPCAVSCDDGIACTNDLTSGSLENCNVECTNVEIVTAADGDGCCPSTANANTDSDCTPTCGNGITETSEACDGGSLCRDCSLLFHRSLVHRYSFDGSGTTLTDSIGAAHGAAINCSVAMGSIDLTSGVNDDYADLPDGLISGLNEVTMEVWLKWDGGGQRQRIFDFGNKSGAYGTSYFFLSPEGLQGALSADMNFTSTANDNADYIAKAGSPLDESAIHHVAVTFAGGTLALYLDGSAEDAVTATGKSLSQIDDRNNWLGRPQFDSAPEFDGLIYEFRIYDQALSGAEIEASYAAGQDP